MTKIRLLFAICMVSIILLLCVKCCKAKKNNYCPPSSCGSIPNISYPFRLKGDLESCGDPSYELSCENNRTVLNLGSKRYYVQSISYSNFSIRVLDPGLENTSCAAFPVNTLTYDDVPRPYTDPIYDIAPDYYQFSTPVTFISCATPAKSFVYVNTSFCSKSTSRQKYTYILVGDDKVVEEVEDSCSIDAFAWLSKEFLIVDNSSLSDIQHGLAYGFMLRWYRFYCRACEARRGSCRIDGDHHIYCYNYCSILEPSTIRPTYKCLNQIWIDNYQKLERLIEFILAGRSLCGFLCLFAWLAYKFKRRHLSMYDNIEDFLQRGNNFTPIRYSYKDLKNMTKNFKDKLGEGAFGTVFKGQLRSGPFAAIKMMGKSQASGQEFISEVATIGRIHHVNVVRLIGFCVENSKRALLYEFMPNGSLEKYIFPREEKISLNYGKMLQIALGVAKGVDYLHRGCDMQILHFDIKPHNILLDDNFTPKISDFGLAKLYPTDKSMVSLTARGTIGYMAPEMFYRNIGQVSYKSDVYSFGMLLMEMASKRRNLNPSVESMSQTYFPSWVHDRFSTGMEIDLGEASMDERVMVKKMIFVALWCIQMKPDDRPSMSKVIEMLEGDVEVLQLPPKPFLSAEEVLVQDSDLDMNDMEFPLLSGSLTSETGLPAH